MQSDRLPRRLLSPKRLGDKPPLPTKRPLGLFLLGGVLLSVAGCFGNPSMLVVAPEKKIPPVHTPDKAEALSSSPPSVVSMARNPQEYRKDAARHIYASNPYRIHQGKLPPLLYAIGVVSIEVNQDGKIQSVDWMRKPKQAPEVILEIEQTIKAAEPFPVPVRLGRVFYTETWLWHKSGKFQLDTLTEGQI